MISTSTHGNSEELLMEKIYELSDAGGSVIQVRTREPIRAALTLRKHLLGSDTPHNEWDIVNGWRRFTKENMADHQVVGDAADFVAAMERPLRDLRNVAGPTHQQPDKVHYYVYVSPQPFMEGNHYVTQLIHQYSAILPSTNICTILITGEDMLPSIPPGLTSTVDMTTPSADELRAVLERTIEDGLKNEESFPDGASISDEEIDELVHLGAGLSLYEFEQYCAISVIQGNLAKDQSITADRLRTGISEGKTSVVRQSDILELVPTGDINQVGGMHRLKDWVTQRADCYSEEAREYGVEPPKGAALVGVPGTGKSLVAKAIAGEFGVPLLRFDFGRVFSKYVGDSEARVRSALKMVESMSPCVLFVDEIDKGLGGGGGGDSGTSSRVLGSFLTWLQECKAPVFTLVTANKVDGLPPELLRRGRFDQIFSVGMSDPTGREEVLRIHLERRGRSIDDYSSNERLQFTEKSEGYVPAEIESAVKDAITAAYSEKAESVTMAHILTALDQMIPMSKSHATAIASIVAWANSNATPVEYTAAMPNPRQAKPAARPATRIVRPTRRGA